jgi:nucleotide-binding universal stress UspA family protein
MFERLLVPLDGSNAAEIVFPYVEEIAARAGSEIILASVSEPTADERDRLYRSYLDHVVHHMQIRLKDWGAKEALKVHGEVLVGKPATEIMSLADKNDVSLMVMASRGLSGQGPWLLGTIAAKILRATVKPVLLIRAPADEASLKNRRLMKRILVPLDGSKAGETAIPCAEALAQGLSAELVLLQVLKHEVLFAGEGDMLGAMYEEDEERKRASAMVYLESVKKTLQDKGLSTSIAVGSGSPADKIIDYAEANTIDLIAMSTHGHSGISRWVFGSVTDKVLHAGDTAVLTVRGTSEK